MRDPVLLQAVDVTCRYPGRAQGRPALDRLSLTLARGEWVAVAGPTVRASPPWPGCWPD